MTDKQLPIFVYGSLRAGFDNHELIDLHHVGITDGIIQDASMYRNHKENFPMVVLDDNSQGAVYGELITLKNSSYDKSLNEMDLLVGNGEFSKRVIVSVMNPETNETVDAWIYTVPDESIAHWENEAEHIDSGDWELYSTAVMDAEFDDTSSKLKEEEDKYHDWDSYEEEFVEYKNTKSATIRPATKASKYIIPSFYMERGTEKDNYIWYVAYGSNLHGLRFLNYMNVGRKKDIFTIEDLESVQVDVPHGIYFAKSGRWGTGGIAFLDVDTKEDFTSPMRAYKMTVQQFWSLVCQENGSRSMTLDWGKIKSERNYKTPQSGLYSRVVNLGTIDGLPAMTATHPESYSSMLSKSKKIPQQYLEMAMINPPSPEYLNIINDGAEETVKLPKAELKEFVAPKPKKMVYQGTALRKTSKSTSRTTTTKSKYNSKSFSKK